MIGPFRPGALAPGSPRGPSPGGRAVMFTQIVDPLGNLFASWLVALVPVVVLLVLLAVLRLSAWLATLLGSLVTFFIAVLVWHMPLDQGALAYLYGSATGMWNVNWITFWGLMLFNTLVATGVFDRFRRWLLAQGTPDVRVQTILFAWAFGALLEGLVGFGYPWAVVAPILITLGIPDLDALRVAAIANNAPVSYGALGAPVIALASVTGLPLLALSSSIGHIVAVLALLPPWILIYLVSGTAGLREGWPLAIVGSLAYIAGQLPVSIYLGPFCPISPAPSSASSRCCCCCRCGGRARCWAMAACPSRRPMSRGHPSVPMASPPARCCRPGCLSPC